MRRALLHVGNGGGEPFAGIWTSEPSWRKLKRLNSGIEGPGWSWPRRRGKGMRKDYEKPVLVKRAKLSAVTAQVAPSDTTEPPPVD